MILRVDWNQKVDSCYPIFHLETVLNWVLTSPLPNPMGGADLQNCDTGFELMNILSLDWNLANLFYMLTKF